MDCAFPQNFHTRKLGEITVLYAVNNIMEMVLFFINKNKLPSVNKMKHS